MNAHTSSTNVPETWLGAWLRWSTVVLLLCGAGLFGAVLREVVDAHGGPWRSGAAVLERSLQILGVPAGPETARPTPAPRFPAGEADGSRAIAFTPGADGTLHAVGDIDAGAALRLRAALDAHGTRLRRVSLDSRGGALDEAIAMGRLLRERRLDAVVEDGALCASSCPLVLAGGVTRRVGPGAVIGLHQFSPAGKSEAEPDRVMADTQLTTARIARHLERMGVDPALWLHALDTPPYALYRLSREELAFYRLAPYAAPGQTNEDARASAQASGSSRP